MGCGISSGLLTIHIVTLVSYSPFFLSWVFESLLYKNRVENEHLNNVGKFRAFKSVPLPFNYDEDDEKDD